MRYFEKQSLTMGTINQALYNRTLKTNPELAKAQYGSGVATMIPGQTVEPGSALHKSYTQDIQNVQKSKVTSTVPKVKLNPWVKGGLIGAGIVGTAAIVSSLTSKPSRVW